MNTSYASWQQLLAERDRLVQLSASEDALSPEELILAVNDLARRLVDMTPGVRWNDAVAAEASEAQLSRLATLCAAAEDRARADQNRLQTLEARAIEYSAVVADIAAQSEMVAQTERRLREVSEAAAAIEPAITSAEDAVAANRRQVTDAQSQVGVLSRAAVAAEQLANAERALQSTLAHLEISDRTVETGQGRRAQASERLAAAIEQVERRGRLSAQLSDARRRVELTEQWTVVRTEVSRLAARTETIDPVALRARRDQVIVERAAAEAEAAGLSAQLRLLDERAAAIAEAVAAIASHLTHDDTDCPVCATPFAVGELLKLARARPAERSSTAFALADAFAAAEGRRSTAVTSLREIETALTDFIQVQAMIAEQRSAEQALLQQLAEVGATGAPSPEVADARKAVEALEIEMRRLDAQIEALGSVEVIRSEHQSAIAALEAEATRRVELIRRQAEYSANAETARAILRQTPELWNADGGFIVDLQSAIEAVRTQFDMASQEQVKLQAVLDDLRQQLEALRSRGTAEEGALLAANTRLRQSGDRRKVLTAAWESAGLSGDPDAARLATQMAIATDRLTGVTQLGERQKRLSAGYRRWLDDEAL